jgi:hypothetical protein
MRVGDGGNSAYTLERMKERMWGGGLSRGFGKGKGLVYSMRKSKYNRSSGRSQLKFSFGGQQGH